MATFRPNTKWFEFGMGCCTGSRAEGSGFLGSYGSGFSDLKLPELIF